MKILIKAAEVFDPESDFNRHVVDLMLENGRITRIGENLNEEGTIIRGNNLKVSPGWMDLNTSFGDPGYEHKEDLQSGLEAARAGGFTAVALMPNNNPVSQTKNSISYLKANNAHNVTQVYPIGAVTIDTAGENLTEMLDLHYAGAIAFSDGTHPVWHTDIMVKALLYLQKIDALLIQRPEDIWLNKFGTMHEGYASTMLGMKGMPSLAEELMIERDLKLLEYTGGKVHFGKISTARSVELIRTAKKKGLKVTCDVAAYQMGFTAEALVNFETNYKVNPPFRDEEDNDALIGGLKDGTIDAIVSAHQPQDEESKNLEFDLADFGVINLQTVWPQLLQLKEKVPLDLLIEKVSTNPRKLTGLKVPTIAEGKKANVTLFDDSEWEFNQKSNFSKANNSPYFKQKLKGKIIASINNDQLYLNEE